MSVLKDEYFLTLNMDSVKNIDIGILRGWSVFLCTILILINADY